MVMSSSCLGQALLLGESAAVVAVVIVRGGASETSIEPRRDNSHDVSSPIKDQCIRYCNSPCCLVQAAENGDLERNLAEKSKKKVECETRADFQVM